jgi:NMD protein affecting ribosome stability and mRNA decay
VHLLKEIKLKEGIDLYIDSSSFAFALAKKAKKELKLESKVTKSLYGFDKTKGKKVHRLTTLLRLD